MTKLILQLTKNKNDGGTVRVVPPSFLWPILIKQQIRTLQQLVKSSDLSYFDLDGYLDKNLDPMARYSPGGSSTFWGSLFSYVLFTTRYIRFQFLNLRMLFFAP